MEALFGLSAVKGLGAHFSFSPFCQIGYFRLSLPKGTRVLSVYHGGGLGPLQLEKCGSAVLGVRRRAVQGGANEVEKEHLEQKWGCFCGRIQKRSCKWGGGGVLNARHSQWVYWSSCSSVMQSAGPPRRQTSSACGFRCTERIPLHPACGFQRERAVPSCQAGTW